MLRDIDYLREGLISTGIPVRDAEPGAYPARNEVIMGRAKDPEDEDLYLILGSGEGYSGFECGFRFDKDGNFIEWSVYE